MPRQYLRQELEIQAGEKEIYVYNKHGGLIQTHKRSYMPKDWMIILSDMPAEYKDYGYWTMPYFQQKAFAVSSSTRTLIDAVIPKLLGHPVLRGEVLSGSSGTLLQRRGFSRKMQLFLYLQYNLNLP